jgi:hypothetical protein
MYRGGGGVRLQKSLNTCVKAFSNCMTGSYSRSEQSMWYSMLLNDLVHLSDFIMWLVSPLLGNNCEISNCTMAHKQQ